jgi:hypothetical protein
MGAATLHAKRHAPEQSIPARTNAHRAEAKPDSRSTAANTASTAPPADPRHAMIAEAAYFRSEKRGFADGHELDDWLAADADIDRQLGGATAARHAPAERAAA